MSVLMYVQMVMLEYVSSKTLTRETCEIMKVRMFFPLIFSSC